MRLPNAASSETPRAKFVDYLLSPTHRDGKGKNAFFRAYGFTPLRRQERADAMKLPAAENDVSRTETTPFGERYVVEGVFYATDGRTANVRSVWFIESGETIPRFVTAYPLPAVI